MAARPPVNAADVLAARTANQPEQRIAALEIRLDALRVEIEALASKLLAAEQRMRSDADANATDPDESAAAAYVRGSAHGTATGLGIAARWAANLAERARRGGA